MPLFSHLTLGQGHILVSMVTKSSLAHEDLECKQQELSPWLSCLEGDITLGQERKSGILGGSLEQEKSLYPKLNFTHAEISLIYSWHTGF